MALQFTLSQQVARLLSRCPSGVRGLVLRELSQRLVGSRPPLRMGLEVGVVRLPSGFQVSYRLDRSREQVEMLDLSGELRLSTAPAPL
ncbi:hypothetical protein F0U60_49580 [Archangium minus]|uniref:Uncharacterized protein n=1 Tax=Archangium minus TaxID=83450 RepID=A0ABY9X7C0_9BACT|nr:hypothetical protein F0U61_49665 [Archangium violaceum]WNG51295.1 hypothetical protein F0U60_49580 [Archangium minus]